MQGVSSPQSIFTKFAKTTARATGHPGSFLLASATIVVWAMTGPLFHYSDTWQLVINTSTTIVTFLMVFLIQNTQNRDSQAVQVKLDELIRSMEGAHNALINLEDLDDAELSLIQARYARLAKEAQKKLENGQPDTDVHDVEEMKNAEQSVKAVREKK